MKRLEILSHTIQYKEVGEGPLLVLVHGYGGMNYDWDEVVDILSKKYRVIVPNLTSIYMDPQRAVSFSQQITIFREFIYSIKKSSKEKIYLAGGSYGAAICYGLVIEDSDCIERMVLLNPMPPYPKQFIKNKAVKLLLDVAKFPPAIMLTLVSPLGRMGLKYIQKIFNVPWIKSNAQKNKLEKITIRKAKLITHVVHRFCWINDVEDWAIWKSRLAYVKIPVHVVWGSKDDLFVPNTYSQLAQKLPHCEVSQIDGGRHVLMKERPEEVSILIEKFLNKNQKNIDLVYDQA